MSTALLDPMASVRSYIAAEKSDNTRRAYATDWADFSTWCAAQGEDPLPTKPIAVARYLAHLADAGKKASTIERRVAAIRSRHMAAGLEPPTGAEGVKAAMRGIRRRVGTKQIRKAPATSEVLSAAIAQLPAPTSRFRAAANCSLSLHFPPGWRLPASPKAQSSAKSIDTAASARPR